MAGEQKTRDQRSGDQTSGNFWTLDLQGYAKICKDLERSAEICRKSLDQTGFGPSRSNVWRSNVRRSNENGDQTSGEKMRMEIKFTEIKRE